MGNEYQKIRKPSKRIGQKELSSFSATSYEVETYFEEDSDEGIMLSFDYSVLDANYYSSMSPFFYSGTYKSNSLQDTLSKYNGSYNYVGGGMRVEGGFSFGGDVISIRPLSFQLVLSMEKGDYFDWRKKIDRKSPEFKNVGTAKFTSSFYYVPEFVAHVSDKVSVGFFAGFGKTYNSDDDLYLSRLFGITASFTHFTFSFSTNRSEFDHYIREYENSGIFDPVIAEETKEATYSKFVFSYSF
jgi:hypothetical protein